MCEVPGSITVGSPFIFPFYYLPVCLLLLSAFCHPRKQRTVKRTLACPLVHEELVEAVQGREKGTVRSCVGRRMVEVGCEVHACASFPAGFKFCFLFLLPLESLLCNRYLPLCALPFQ